MSNRMSEQYVRVGITRSKVIDSDKKTPMYVYQQLSLTQQNRHQHSPMGTEFPDRQRRSFKEAPTSPKIWKVATVKPPWDTGWHGWHANCEIWVTWKWDDKTNPVPETDASLVDWKLGILKQTHDVWNPMVFGGWQFQILKHDRLI